MNNQIQHKDLLIEIGLAELPTNAVEDLSQAWLDGFSAELKQLNINFTSIARFATARRLALLFTDIETQQKDQPIEKRGPAIKAAKDSEGNWSKAASGFAASCGVSPDDLVIETTDKGEWLYFKGIQSGQPLASLLPNLIKTTLNALPISKKMRWGDKKDSFVRPVLSFVVLLDDEVIDCEIFGVSSSNQSIGHRFHKNKQITLSSPRDYESSLLQNHIMVNIDTRRQSIVDQTNQLASDIGANAIIDDYTLREVNALVEWPVAILGDFNHKYLNIPQEVLIKTMQDNQKYFPVTDKSGQLISHFITISNIESKQPEIVKKGNQRVIEPRFADAEFFWENDKKTTLESRQQTLKKVVYQHKLGSVFERSQRITCIAELIAKAMGESPDNVIRAAKLAKCDLVTEMVFEFGELQGIIGQYYAENDGENSEVSNAIREQYLPKFSGDNLPTTMTGKILSLADKLENLIGGFAIGAKPTGTKDPYALRRASLGIIRLLNETELNLSLPALLQQASAVFPQQINADKQLDNILLYIQERLKGYYAEQQIKPDVFESVASVNPDKIQDFTNRIKAVSSFMNEASAPNLLAANKRISNILKKVSLDNTEIKQDLLRLPEEKNLYNTLIKLDKDVATFIKNSNYQEALTTLSELREPLDQFFDAVMVMSDIEDEKINRIALLTKIRLQFLSIADLSLISI